MKVPDILDYWNSKYKQDGMMIKACNFHVNSDKSNKTKFLKDICCTFSSCSNFVMDTFIYSKKFNAE